MRTVITEKTVYSFAELNDSAKEKARDWWRECEAQDWHGADSVIEDAERVAENLGIEFATRQVKLMNGTTRPESRVYWSGFHSQGDGACFEGRYSYAKGCTKKIREYAPQDARLHSIADNLQAAQKKHSYKLQASMSHRGHYYHSGCMAVDVEHADDSYRDIGDAEDSIRGAMRAFADWIYRQLESEYEYTMVDETVDENIECNGYEFDENGRIQ